MEFIQRFFLYGCFVALTCLIVGLFKPWIMLWWEDTQNRRKVLKLYGTAAAVSFVLYLVAHLF